MYTFMIVTVAGLPRVRGVGDLDLHRSQRDSEFGEHVRCVAQC